MSDTMTDICQQVDGKSVSLVVTSPSRTAAATAAAAAVRQRGDCGRGTSAHVFAPRLSAPAPSQTEGLLLSEKLFFLQNPKPNIHTQLVTCVQFVYLLFERRTPISALVSNTA